MEPQSDAGYALLEWQPAPAQDRFEVQQSSNPDFSNATQIYAGMTPAAFVSGLRGGTYYYRVRSGDSDWSEPFVLHVIHHDVTAALGYFAAGATVFVSTLLFLLFARRRHSP